MLAGAINVPFLSLLEGEAPSGAFKDPPALRAAFEQAGVSLDKPILCTCGSGATACHLAHALAQLDLPLVRQRSTRNQPGCSGMRMCTYRSQQCTVRFTRVHLHCHSGSYH
jgi:hypothetical protein